MMGRQDLGKLDLEQAASKAFAERFGHAPDCVATAPGRVNLLGEHTDYNGGFVLPMPLRLEIAVAIGYSEQPGQATIYSQSLQSSASINLSHGAQGKTGQWTDFILGCFLLSETPPDLARGYNILIDSTLPMGAGISSSAALEVSCLRALAALSQAELDPVILAKTAQKVERDFVGMPCGIMDQFVCSAGTHDMALFLDTRSLEFELAPLIDGHKMVTLHSGVAHKLTDGSYEQRVEECNRACAALGIEQLRDIGINDLSRIEALGGVEAKRARHVVTENQRVLDGLKALKAHDAAEFGRLMTQSHASQRDDYAITVEETDAMVVSATELGALGARQTGGGFGGSIVALVKDDRVENWCASMAERYPQSHILAIT